MSDNAPRQPEQLKLLAKHWKGKIFSSDAALEKEANEKLRLNDDVDDFLRPSTNKPPSRPLNGASTHQLGRIDTSSAKRWPSASEINAKAREVETLESDAHQRPSSSKKKNKGLTVKFTEGQPEIIGEGGDEAEEPPCEITRSRARFRPPLPGRSGDRRPSQTLDGQDAARLSSRKSSVSDPVVNDHPSRMPLLSRKPASFSQGDARTPTPQSSAADLAEDYISLIESSAGTDGPSDYRAKDRAMGRAEEGLALKQGYLQPISVEEEKPLQESIEEALSPKTIPGPSTLSFSNGPPSMSRSAHPTPFPRPSPLPSPNAQGYFAPKVAIPSPRPDAAMLSPDYPTPLFVGEAGRRPTLTSLRSATSTLGDDAVEDFSTRVHHLNRVFQLSAEAARPFSETSLTQWVRAALWWFAKGRRELENAIRSSPATGAAAQGGRATSQRTNQSFVDLAKSWWIVQEVVPQHAELRHYGNGPMSTIIDLARRRGDAMTAELVDTRETICAKFRALALSMKRNGFLPPSADAPLLAQGLSTNIWIAYPVFNPEVSSILSGNVSRSLVLQTSSSSTHPGDCIPLGDMDRYFTYTRLFVDVYVTDDASHSQEHKLPCVLSILRDHTDWQIKAMIASQNDVVNLSVQSNNDVGPTWSNVIWTSQQSLMTIRLPSRGFALHVHFEDRDYRALRGLYDHSQKVEASLHPETDEVVSFSDIARSCHYLDPDPKSSTFPKEPSSRCRVSLFEKKISQSEGSGVRRLHRGYRLVVLTSPKAKTIGIINRPLGRQQVIESSLVLKEDRQQTVVLHFRKEGRQSSLFLTFQAEDQRVQFLSHLNGTAVQGEEAVVADLALRSFSVAKRGEDFGQTGSDTLRSLGWQRVKVINKDPDDPDYSQSKTVLSDSLRICAESKSGSVTDRVNLGK